MHSNVCVWYLVLEFFQGAIASSERERSWFGTTRSGSKYSSIPIPWHLGHAPNGLLKENILGSISVIWNPEIGQENFSENTKIYSFFSITSTNNNPSPIFKADSTLSVSLVCILSSITNRSTNISISCFLFLSMVGKSFSS